MVHFPRKIFNTLHCCEIFTNAECTSFSGTLFLLRKGDTLYPLIAVHPLLVHNRVSNVHLIGSMMPRRGPSPLSHVNTLQRARIKVNFQRVKKCGIATSVNVLQSFRWKHKILFWTSHISLPICQFLAFHGHPQNFFDGDISSVVCKMERTGNVCIARFLTGWVSVVKKLL